MTQSVQERIEREIGERDVVLFIRGSPVVPPCGFSARVVRIMSGLGIKFKSLDVLSDPALRQGI